MANSDQSKYRAERADRVRARRSRQLSTLRTAIKKLRKGLLEKASKENLAELEKAENELESLISREGFEL